MRKIRGAIGLFAVLAVIAAGCTNSGSGGGDADGGGSGGSGERVTLNFWVFHEGGIGRFLETLESDFETKNPNIDLNIQEFPENSYGVKLDTAIAAGKAPDLTVYPDLDQIRKGLIMPIDDAMTEAGVDLSTFSQAIVQPGDEFSCAYEDHLYCIGTYTGSVQLLYNKDMFDAAGIPYPAPWPPMTPDEFVDIACKLTDQANGVWGGAASDPLAYLPFEMLVSPDGRTAEGYFNGPDMVHQFEVLASGYDRGCIPSSNVMDPWEQGRDYFAKGQLAMVITDFQDLPKVEKAGINYGSTASPTPAGWDPYFFVWTDAVAIMASTEHPDEAKTFVEYLATDAQKIRYDTTGDIPLDLSVADAVHWAQGIPGREDGLEVLKHSRSMIFIPNRWDAIAPYYDAWGYVLGGEKSAQQALDDAAPAVQENLDKEWAAWEKGSG